MNQPPLPPLPGVPGATRSDVPFVPVAVAIQPARGATVSVGGGGPTTYHQHTSGSQSGVAVGKTVILRVNMPLGPGERQNGGTTSTAADVAVLP